MKSALLLLALTAVLSAQSSLSGLWDAQVTVNEVAIPFRFEISTSGTAASASFFNGDERVRSSGGKFENGDLTLEFAHYGSKLVAKVEGGKLTGTYGRRGRAPYVFEAKRFVAPETGSAKAPSIAGLWTIPTKSSKGESAWQLIIRQSGPEVSAAILRIDGDTGTLSGTYRDGVFRLSHFSGARPALLEVKANADGTLDLVQNGGTKLTAVRTNEARLKGLPEPTDPSRHTSVKDPSQPLRFSGVDLNGKTVNESDSRFAGKVVILNIGGSWCPNCHDEAPFLVELDRKYRSKGLEIVTLSFEEAEQLTDLARLKAFVALYGIKYTMLVGGETGQLAEKLPQAVNLNTWPATFFIGRDGLVRGSHAGFASKATGKAHEDLKTELRRTVEKLLSETVRSKNALGEN